MFRPNDIDYSRLDVAALLTTRGIAAVDAIRRKPCERWLAQHGYDVAVVDFGASFPEVLTELGAILGWERQFGYRLEEGRAKLNALADGFEFPISAEHGHVLMVLRPETLAGSTPEWFDGFLEIASDHSLFHLACGSRFFTLLVLTRDSALPGRNYGVCRVPSAYRNLDARKHGFVE